MSTILTVSSVNDGQYKTSISGKNSSLNDNDFQAIEKVLSSGGIKRDGNKILLKDSIDNVIQAIENGGDYYDEYKDPTTQEHQLTPTNANQGKTPQLRQ